MTASGDGAPANSLRRGFLAVVPPPEVLDAVERRAAPVRNLRVGPRWTTRDQWHLTVQFLGAVPDVDLLGKAVADAVREMEPFAVQVGGGGGFPSERRCRVLWLGIHERTARLAELARRITGATGMVEASEGHYGGELMRSLEAFIEENGQWERAARRLYCHRHTLRYRIRRVEELTGRSLGSARDRIEFWLALRGRELVSSS